MTSPTLVKVHESGILRKSVLTLYNRDWSWFNTVEVLKGHTWSSQHGTNLVGGHKSQFFQHFLYEQVQLYMFITCV